jgi:hypothetical protein
MTPILEKAIAHLSTLPTHQQDFMAAFIFNEITFKEGYQEILNKQATAAELEQVALMAMREYNLRLQRNIESHLGDR